MNESHSTFLKPGEFAFASPGARIHTLLGSCVSITLWHPRLRIGGMCHFTLPSRSKHSSLAGGPDGRYADEAMELFRRAAVRYSTRLTAYQAKIFGGGNLIRDNGEPVDDSIGSRNVTAAMQLLLQEGIEILVAHVGEFGHRRIVFDISTGDVWVRYQPTQGKRPASLSGRV